MAQQYESRNERVQQIAQAALELIAQDGLRRFTTKAIAEKVGITDGTIFRHFKNKEEIVLAAIDRLEERMFLDAFPEEKDPFQRLEKFFRKRALLLGQQSSLGRLFFSEQLSHVAGEDGLAKIKSWRVRNMAFVRQCLLDMQDAGKLPSEIPAQDFGVIVQGTLLTFAFQRMTGQNADTDLEDRIDRGWRMIARSLRP